MTEELGIKTCGNDGCNIGIPREWKFCSVCQQILIQQGKFKAKPKPRGLEKWIEKKK